MHANIYDIMLELLNKNTVVNFMHLSSDQPLEEVLN